MTRRLSIMAGLAGALTLCACTRPVESGVKVIVGARLDSNSDRDPIEYSVVVIEGGKFRAVGPQADIPVPKGATIIRGLGLTILPVPGGEAIATGHPANLLLEGGGALREMRNGEWVH
jgi:hypothetical protein